MAAPYVTGTAILAHVASGSTPSADADDVAWAGDCADAIEAAIAARLDGATPSAGFEAELVRSALQDGAAAYLERRAPHGVLSVTPDGDAVRLGAEILRATAPVLRRHLETAGVGIG